MSMMYTNASLFGVISCLSDQVQNLLQENLKHLHKQARSVQVGQEEEKDKEEVLGLHARDETSTSPELIISREEIQKIVVAQLKQAKGDVLQSDCDKPCPSFHDQFSYPEDKVFPSLSSSTT